ncbi:MAG TPA: hypothetical protein VGO11_05725 [Chthoniobacteraceae bacterium]|nr:hypothetical protein [Chthoniobacteraceae bacterium]
MQVHASWTGKWATALQMAAIIIVGLQLNFFTKDFTLFGRTFEQLHSRGHGDGGFTEGTGKKDK